MNMPKVNVPGVNLGPLMVLLERIATALERLADTNDRQLELLSPKKRPDDG